jgi:sensor domain CHASE-containing protein
MKVETFQNINEAVNFVLDNNLQHINIAKFEEQLMNKHAYKSQTYNIIFLIDEHGILTTD